MKKLFLLSLLSLMVSCKIYQPTEIEITGRVLKIHKSRSAIMFEDIETKEMFPVCVNVSDTLKVNDTITICITKNRLNHVVNEN